MRLLLDTHVLIWALADDAALAPRARRAIEHEADAVLVSSASVWEVAIKQALGRIQIESGREIGELALEAGFEPLPIGLDHAAAVADLPPHHGDPFDRMLVAQASVDGLVLATADDDLTRYDVPILAARR